jgi:hypothetical protein
MSNPPAGWYPDPTGRPNTIRWWNGTQWTNKTEQETDADGEANQPDDPGTDDTGTDDTGTDDPATDETLTAKVRKPLPRRSLPRPGHSRPGPSPTKPSPSRRSHNSASHRRASQNPASQNPSSHRPVHRPGRPVEPLRSNSRKRTPRGSSLAKAGRRSRTKGGPKEGTKPGRTGRTKPGRKILPSKLQRRFHRKFHQGQPTSGRARAVGSNLGRNRARARPASTVRLHRNRRRTSGRRLR